ncbi:hypothetical protein L2E82_43539 [Cichorium intybus]|uniref:Uncharacterized protein n=1 Tax=Cichorium intybus TaxID=13427 RepID=A0ACB8ZNY2_CICIN|nr:hypothetical protein L2E82_43539 [Cichorium intybus]
MIPTSTVPQTGDISRIPLSCLCALTYYSWVSCKLPIQTVLEMHIVELTSLRAKITTLEEDLKKAREESSENQHLYQQLEKELKELKNTEQQLKPKRMKVISDLLISVSKAERQEAIMKVRHDSLRLGNVRVISIDERSREINFKDERIKQLETTVLEKSNSLASLRSEIESLQVEDLKNEIAKQKTKKDALEARINVAETKILEINEKLKKLQKTNEEQNIRIRNTEHALKKAEEERIKVQLKVARYSKEPIDFHESWLPP